MKATEPQLKFLKDLGVSFNENITKEEAVILIKKNVPPFDEQQDILKLLGYNDISGFTEYSANQEIALRLKEKTTFDNVLKKRLPKQIREMVINFGK